jgi:hypothetical protein
LRGDETTRPRDHGTAGPWDHKPSEPSLLLRGAERGSNHAGSQQALGEQTRLQPLSHSRILDYQRPNQGRTPPVPQTAPPKTSRRTAAWRCGFSSVCHCSKVIRNDSIFARMASGVIPSGRRREDTHSRADGTKPVPHRRDGTGAEIFGDGGQNPKPRSSRREEAHAGVNGGPRDQKPKGPINQNSRSTSGGRGTDARPTNPKSKIPQALPIDLARSFNR